MVIKNLVFEGGGLKGLGYVGAITGLEEALDVHQIIRVGGTSAGAIFSLLFALKYTADELEHMCLNLNFRQFMDDDIGFVRDTNRLLTEFGWHKGNKLTQWAQEIVQAKTGNKNTSFAELKGMLYQGKQKFRDLYIVGANLNTGNAEVFSYETKHAAVPIALAARLSAAIPLFFRPIFLNHAYYVDGGVIRNYPITLFDDWKYNPNIPAETIVPFNQETLGLRLQTPEEIKKFLDPNIDNRQFPVANFMQYARALISLISDVQTEAHFHSFDQFRTIYCNPLDIHTTEFDIPIEKRQQIIAAGYDAVKKFFTPEACQERLSQHNIYRRNQVNLSASAPVQYQADLVGVE